MENKYCSAGKIECEYVGDCPGEHMNQCPYLLSQQSSKQKPIAPVDEPCGVCENCNPQPIIPLQNKKPFQKFEWKSDYDRGKTDFQKQITEQMAEAVKPEVEAKLQQAYAKGFAAAKAQAVERLKMALSVVYERNFISAIETCIAAIEAIEVKHD